MQTTLLGLAIAFIIALVAALIGPYFIDWNQFRPQFEAEAAKVVGAPVRVGGELDARLLPTPSLRLRSITIGGANDLGKVHADKLDVEFSLGSLMRGEWRADQLTVNGLSLDLGLDPRGKIELPASTGKFNLGSLSIDRLNLTGRVALHDAASRGTLELNDIAFSGDVRSLAAGAVRGDGNFTLSGLRYPFRISSGQSTDGNGTRVHLNIDPGARALSIDLDGVLSFEARAPRFDGALVLSVPAGLKAQANVPITPWRIAARLKADPATARLEQIEMSYGLEERALKLAGSGDLRFGAAPLLHAVLSARQLDADRFTAKDSGKDATKDNVAAEPLRVVPGLRALMTALPLPPIPTRIEFSAEQIMFGGRPVQNVAADLRSGARSWAIERLDLRAPGATLVSLTGAGAPSGPSDFAGALSIDSSDPDTLAAWLQGRSEVALRSQKPLRLHGNVSVTEDRVAIDAMKADLDGGTVEGRVALSNKTAAGGSRLEAELKGERLDLDAATAFARSLAGPQAEWPEEALVSLDIGRATSAGQELRPLVARLGYDQKTITLDRLRIGDASGVMLDGAGKFDRTSLVGTLQLDSTAANPGRLTALIAPLSPALAARLTALGTDQGPVRAKLALGLDSNKARADGPIASAQLDVEAPQFTGHVTLGAEPDVAALRALDLEKLRRGAFSATARLSAGQGRALLAALGLDRAIAAGEGPAQFEGSVSGAWQSPLRLKARLTGTGLDAEAEGSTEPWARDTKASVNLNVRGVSLAPLLNLQPADALARNINLTARVSLAGGRLAFDDLDSVLGGSRLRGHVALTLDEEKSVEGEIGLDTLDLAPAFALAIGAAGHDTAEPLGAGLLKGWRGRIAFQALRGALPGGGELRPVSGAVRSDGQSLTFEAIKGGIGGGQANANFDARPGANGVALNARVELSGVDGSALRYRALAMPAGRISMQMTLSSQGRSASALTGALSGSGTVTLEAARVAGLDPRAFDAAIRASDNGQATDDARLRQIVEPVLSGGALSVKPAQIPFSIGDGRLRVGATTLEADGARAIISGGYDIPADQVDIRATLASTSIGQATSRPEIHLFSAGSPDALNRSVDVAALSSWLAVRAIDRETRRLDSIERGEPPPPATSASIPSSAATPDAAPSDLPTSDVPTPGRDPRRLPPRPKVSAPRPPAAPPNLPAGNSPGSSSSNSPGNPPAPNSPVVSQQVAPLPPPIEIRPAPGAVVRPRPKPPLVLTPPTANPQRPAF